jgi:hypothetical protein
VRRAARIDDNHPAIVEAFQKMGCSVLSLAPMGKGVPDLLVGCGMKNYLVEVKDGEKVPSARKLTPDETRFCRTWLGHWQKVETVPEAIACVKEWRKL